MGPNRHILERKNMDHLVELVKATAWPVAAIWLGYIFRFELRQLLGRVSTVKYGDVEASFGQNLDKAEKNAQGIVSPHVEETEEDLGQKELLFRIAEVSPRAAVVEAWTLIEMAAMKNGIWSGATIKRTNPKMILSHLEASGKFSPDSLKLIQQLKQIRNQASHLPDFAITQSEAERYLDLAIKSAAVIESTAS